jgi:hypothetical protein
MLIMKHFKKVAVVVAAAAALAGGLTACDHDSDVASRNLSNDADQFKVFRQIVVYNGITDKYIMEIDGYCALGNHDPGDEVSYTCKTSQGYIKDIIKKSDNTFVFVHQLHPKDVSKDFFQVTLKPTEVLPNFNH